MSTTPTSPPPTSGVPSAKATRKTDEVVVVSHSPLVYWWPVWAVGFIMAFLTWFDGHRMVLIPTGARFEGNTLVAATGSNLPPNFSLEAQRPRRMAEKKSLGVVFAFVLVLLIIVTNVPMHGLWSVIVVLLLFLLSVIFALAAWWEIILEWLDLLDIRINLGGYFFMALALFIAWSISTYIFDKRHYMIVSPGQIRMCLAIGAGETAYDTTGVVFQKRQDDMFRHWVLGLASSGDLWVRTSGAHPQEIHLPNVFRVRAKLAQIEQMLKEREVV
jgi:hypothetical protein